MRGAPYIESENHGTDRSPGQAASQHGPSPQPAIIIGKSDVNEGTVEQTVAYLEKHELVKCSVLDGSSLSAREAAEELAERCHAEVVQVIGRKFSLYRESSRKDIEKIKLV